MYLHIACACRFRSPHVRLASSWVGARILCARLCLPVLGLEPASNHKHQIIQTYKLKNGQTTKITKIVHDHVSVNFSTCCIMQTRPIFAKLVRVADESSDSIRSSAPEASPTSLFICCRYVRKHDMNTNQTPYRQYDDTIYTCDMFENDSYANEHNQINHG